MNKLARVQVLETKFHKDDLHKRLSGDLELNELGDFARHVLRDPEIAKDLTAAELPPEKHAAAESFLRRLEKPRFFDQMMDAGRALGQSAAACASQVVRLKMAIEKQEARARFIRNVHYTDLELIRAKLDHFKKALIGKSPRDVAKLPEHARRRHQRSSGIRPAGAPRSDQRSRRAPNPASPHRPRSLRGIRSQGRGNK